MSLSIISPSGYHRSSCGYCSGTTKSSCSYGLFVHTISPYHYQKLINLGWRRSGDYVYKPDNFRTCCQQIPIRLDVNRFQPTKTQKRTLNRLLFYVRNGNPKPAKWKGKWSRGRDWNVLHRWNEIEAKGNQNDWAEKVAGKIQNRLEIRLVLASSTDEKYQLYRKYQTKVHDESQDKIGSQNSWQRFLVDSSMSYTWPTTNKALTENERKLWNQKVADPLDAFQEIPYGNYHQEYRLNDKLIAVGVLDILPICVSSVYFYYDPDYKELELGKVSGLREIALTKQLSCKKGMASIQFYYLGFYIHTCPKMRYKAEYKPSELLDCATNEWMEFAPLESSLDQGVRFAFKQGGKPIMDQCKANSEKESQEQDDQEESIPISPFPPPGMLDPQELLGCLARDTLRPPDKNLQLISRAWVLEAERQHVGVNRIMTSSYATEFLSKGESKRFRQIMECIAALNDQELVSQFVLFV